jgi:hypothetical protein
MLVHRTFLKIVSHFQSTSLACHRYACSLAGRQPSRRAADAGEELVHAQRHPFQLSLRDLGHGLLLQ